MSRVNGERMSTLIYRYGLLDPIDWDEDCREQLWRRNALWNRLVEIDHAHRERYFRLLSAEPAVAGLEQRLAVLLERQSALRAERKAARQVSRTKQATPVIDEALREVSREIQPLKAQLKTARALSRDGLREELRAIEAERFIRVREAAHTSGVYWCTSNAVLNAYDAARSKAMREGAQLRFHRFEGEGGFEVQFIGGVHLDELTAGEHAMARLDLTPQSVPGKERVWCKDGVARGGRLQPRLSITAYMREEDGKRRHRKLTFPIVLDRPLPAILAEGREEARIQEITVTRRRCGLRFAWHAVFKLRVPEAIPAHPYPSRACALNLGFRERPDGALRVGMLIDAAGTEREITLPKAWRDRLRSAEVIRGARDTHLEAVSAQLRREWCPQGAPAILTERVSNLLRAPKFGAGKLAGCILLWCDDPQFATHQSELLAALESWRRTDKHYLECEANGRRKALAHREDLYRQFARELASQYGEIRIGEIDLKALALLERPDGQENELHALARANRHEASLYQLQKEIKRQAAKAGARIIEVPGPYTPICHTCGQSMPVDRDLIVVCPQGHVWDQDVVAARNILAAACERSGDDGVSGERSPQKKQRLTRVQRMHEARARRSGAEVSQTASQTPDPGGV